MKTTTKFLAGAVAAVALFFTTSVNAQTKLGIGLNVGAPTSDASDAYSVAVGVDARLQFDVSKQISIPVTTGYTTFIGKNDVGGVYDVPNFGFIPVKAGVKVFFNDSGSGLYGLAELGAAFGVTNGSGTSFIYSPALGYSWSNGLDLGLKYEGLSRNSATVGQVAVRVAYGFNL